jgi:hypothetical protein
MDQTLGAPAIKEIERLARGAANEEKATIEVNGETLYRGGYQRLVPHEAEGPKVLPLSTLQGLADFVNDNADEEFTKGRRRFVSVDSPTEVSYWLGAAGREKRRDVIACAKAVTPNLAAVILPLSSLNDPRAYWPDPETFRVHVEALFEKSEARDRLCSLISAIEWSAAEKVADDGISAVYTTRVGVKVGDGVTGDTMVAKNPWTLQAYRTFAGEGFSQPDARYLLRTRCADKKVALFEVGDGMYRAVAITRIVAKLRELIKTEGVTVIG